MFTKLYWFEFQAKVTLVRGLFHDQWLGISIQIPNSRLRLSKKNTGLIVGVPPITELCHLLTNLICVNFRKHGRDNRF